MEENNHDKYAEVILPVPIQGSFTYKIPFSLTGEVCLFGRVVVPFGKGKFHTGIVVNIHSIPPNNYVAKNIELVLDENPIITNKQYQLWKWIANYYMAPLGDVMNAALPSNFKLASETKLVKHPDIDLTRYELSDREVLILDALDIQEFITLQDISQIVGIKTIHPIIKKMMDKNLLIAQEELNEKFTPKTSSFISINPIYNDDTLLEDFLTELSQKKSAEKQIEAIVTFLKCAERKDGIYLSVLKKQLENEGVSVSAINSLEKKEFWITERKIVSRIDKNDNNFVEELPNLSEAQQNCLDEVKLQMQDKLASLLHGVTGSGKTELYIHLIHEVLHNQEKQVLFLLPEIALTTQLIQRLHRFFGDAVGVYHSRFNPNERVEIWNHVLNNSSSKFRLIVGARSAVFLPFQDLGLIIVDEEHEGSYKQQDPSPRYQARDLSLVIASLFKTKVLLGSATPSIETHQNVQLGKYGYAALTKRYSDVQLPEILCVDMKEERKKKSLNGLFSTFLLDEIRLTIQNNEQVILFQNRRGYTPLWTCQVCDFQPNCVNCDTTLTYHKHSNVLKCHHCSYATSPMGSCPVCGSNDLRMVGFGTEKIEDDLSLIMPNLRLARMDYDTTRSKNGYLKLINDFSDGKLDVLIGTQMVAKGLDFDSVGLVGILDADSMLTKTDFRALERAYQLMSQVSGRAGRRNKRGKVIVQTSNPDNWVIKLVIENDFKTFAENELIERKNYFYPPFYRLIDFTIKHKSNALVDEASAYFADELIKIFKERVIGPEYPPIPRIQNYYLKKIRLKLEYDAPQQKIKERLRQIIDQFYTEIRFKSVRIITDVDPY